MTKPGHSDISLGLSNKVKDSFRDKVKDYFGLGLGIGIGLGLEIKVRNRVRNRGRVR